MFFIAPSAVGLKQGPSRQTTRKVILLSASRGHSFTRAHNVPILNVCLQEQFFTIRNF